MVRSFFRLKFQITFLQCLVYLWLKYFTTHLEERFAGSPHSSVSAVSAMSFFLRMHLIAKKKLVLKPVIRMNFTEVSWLKLHRWKLACDCSSQTNLALVVQRLESVVQRINHYPSKKYYQNLLIYPVDSNSFNGQCYAVDKSLDYVNNRMLKHDWLVTALIYGLMGCFRSKLSNLTCLITSVCNWTGQIRQLSSQ